MYAPVPAVHRADKADAASAGRPHRKVRSGNARDGVQVRAQFFIRVVVPALAHQVQIEIAEQEGKGVWVEDLEGIAMKGAALNFVAAGLRRGGLIGRPHGFEEPLGPKLDGIGDLSRGMGGVFEDDTGFRGPGKKEPDRPTVGHRVRPEQAKGIGVAPGQERIDTRVQVGARLPFDGSNSGGFEIFGRQRRTLRRFLARAVRQPDIGMPTEGQCKQSRKKWKVSSRERCRYSVRVKEAERASAACRDGAKKWTKREKRRSCKRLRL